MAKREYVYVTCMSAVFRLTTRNYTRFLRRAAQGKEWSLEAEADMAALQAAVTPKRPRAVA
jgi:hypothetical protein